MSVYRMNSAQSMKFVELYIDSECLWNVKLPSYRQREARDQAYKYIEEEMQIPGFGPKEVAQKIKNIRTTYKKELNKISRSEVATARDTVYTPKVPWFGFVDTYLRNVVAVPNTMSNLKKEEPQEHVKDGTADELSEHANQQAEDERVTQSYSPQSTLHTPGPRSMQLKSKQPGAPVYATEGLENSLENPKNIQSPETEFDVWARSVAMQLNSMEVHRALQLQLQIQSLVCNERIAYESKKARYQHPGEEVEFGPSSSTQSAQTNWLQNTGMRQDGTLVKEEIQEAGSSSTVWPLSIHEATSPDEAEDNIDSYSSSE